MREQLFAGGFRKLLAWQQAHAFTQSIYKSTQTFPHEERYGIVDQMRRASTSVGAQIAEGSRMESLRHRKLFYQRAYASLAEADNFLELAHDLKYIDTTSYKQLLEQLNKASFLLYRLIRSCSP